MKPEFVEFDEYWKNPNIKLDIEIKRQELWWVKNENNMKTTFHPRKKLSTCDNATDRRGFNRGSWKTKTSMCWGLKK